MDFPIDVEELLAERGITVDHVTVCRWVQRFTPEFTEAARPGRHVPGNPVVVRRHVPEGRRKAGLSLTGGRSAWPGHRRPGVSEARPCGPAPFLRPGAPHPHHPRPAHHR